MKKMKKERMMNGHYSWFTLSSLAILTPIMGASITEQQTLLNDLVNKFKTNQELMRMNQSEAERAISAQVRQSLAQRIQELKEENRAIIQQAIKAGIITAFVAAITSIAILAAKKYGTSASSKKREEQEEIGEDPEVEELLKKSNNL